MKTLKKVVVNNVTVRTVEVQPGCFRAQIKHRGETKFQLYGPDCETEDHAGWWAFHAIEHHCQDKHFCLKRAG